MVFSCVKPSRGGWREDNKRSGFGLWSESGESGAEGGEKRIVKRSRRATPAANRRRKPAAAAANAIAARDERVDLRSGTGVVEGQQGDGQPVERSKPRVGHGG